MSLSEGGRDLTQLEIRALKQDTTLLKVKMKAVQTKNARNASLGGKSRFSSGASRGRMTLLGTGFQPNNTVLDFLPTELYETKYVLFKVTKSVAIHCSSHRNLIEIFIIGCGFLL